MNVTPDIAVTGLRGREHSESDHHFTQRRHHSITRIIRISKQPQGSGFDLDDCCK